MVALFGVMICAIFMVSALNLEIANTWEDEVLVETHSSIQSILTLSNEF